MASSSLSSDQLGSAGSQEAGDEALQTGGRGKRKYLDFQHRRQHPPRNHWPATLMHSGAPTPTPPAQRPNRSSSLSQPLQLPPPPPVQPQPNTADLENPPPPHSYNAADPIVPLSILQSSLNLMASSSLSSDMLGSAGSREAGDEARQTGGRGKRKFLNIQHRRQRPRKRRPPTLVHSAAPTPTPRAHRRNPSSSLLQPCQLPPPPVQPELNSADLESSPPPHSYNPADPIVPLSILQSLESSLNFRPSSSLSFDHLGSSRSQEAVEEAPHTRGRGKTKCLDSQHHQGKIHLVCNGLNQVINDDANKMSSYLGTLARNNQLCPIYKADWRELKSYWNKLFDLFEEKFSYDIPKEEMKRIVLQSIGTKWKNYKSKLKEHFDPMLSDEENFERRPADVLPDQWEQLVLLFRKRQDHSVKAKLSRSKVKVNHTLGRKSCARKRKEMEDKKGVGEVSPFEFWKASHVRKDSEDLCGEAAMLEVEAKRKLEEKIGGSSISTEERFALEREVLCEILAPEHSGRVRGQGLGVNPTRYRSYCNKQSENLEVHGLKRKLEEMSQQMIEAEEKRELKVKEMEEELARKAQAEQERDKKMKQMEEEMRELRRLLLPSKKPKKRATRK